MSETALSTPVNATDRQWFVRLLPRWAVWAMGPFIAVGMLCGLAVSMGAHSVLEALGVLVALKGLFGEGALYGGLALPYLLGAVVGWCCYMGWEGRRYNACVFSTTHLTSLGACAQRPEETPALDEALGAHVPLEGGLGWTRTRQGLLLRVDGRGWLSRLVFPVLIPVGSAEELALAEGLLRARRRPPVEAGS
jgi:hypothetical protein